MISEEMFSKSLLFTFFVESYQKNRQRNKQKERKLKFARKLFPKLPLFPLFTLF